MVHLIIHPQMAVPDNQVILTINRPHLQFLKFPKRQAYQTLRRDRTLALPHCSLPPLPKQLNHRSEWPFQMYYLSPSNSTVRLNLIGIGH